MYSHVSCLALVTRAMLEGYSLFLFLDPTCSALINTCGQENLPQYGPPGVAGTRKNMKQSDRIHSAIQGHLTEQLLLPPAKNSIITEEEKRLLVWFV